MALVFARDLAAAEFGLCPAAAPNLGPRRPVRVGCFSPAGSTMLRGLIWCCHVLVMGLPAGTAGLKRHRSITMEFAVALGAAMVDSLLDAASHGPAGRWVLLCPTR